MDIRELPAMGRPSIRLVVLGMLAILASVAGAGAAELILMEQPGCPWCERWDAEIGPAYPNTSEGQLAPLRRVDITGAWPADLATIRRERFTPTFVLLDKGAEVARLRGYPGDQFFWFLLDEMLAKLPAEVKEGG
jgi:hypothetical protein